MRVNIYLSICFAPVNYVKVDFFTFSVFLFVLFFLIAISPVPSMVPGKSKMFNQYLVDNCWICYPENICRPGLRKQNGPLPTLWVTLVCYLTTPRFQFLPDKEVGAEIHYDLFQLCFLFLSWMVIWKCS